MFMSRTLAREGVCMRWRVEVCSRWLSADAFCQRVSVVHSSKARDIKIRGRVALIFAWFPVLTTGFTLPY